MDEAQSQSEELGEEERLGKEMSERQPGTRRQGRAPLRQVDVSMAVVVVIVVVTVVTAQASKGQAQERSDAMVTKSSKNEQVHRQKPDDIAIPPS